MIKDKVNCSINKILMLNGKTFYTALVLHFKLIKINEIKIKKKEVFQIAATNESDLALEMEPFCQHFVD